MPDNVKKVRISFTKRPIPKNGPMQSDDYNSSIDEILLDLNTLASAWNADVQPILESLPHGSNEDRWDLPASIDPAANGLDGTQIFMDSSATASSDTGRYWYTDENYARPKTIKEISGDLYDDIVEFKTDVLDQLGNISNGLSTDQWGRLGIWVREGGVTSSAADSVDGITRTNRTRLENTIDDIYAAGDPPGSRLTYPVQEMVDALAILHNGADWSDDPSTWTHSLGAGTIAQTAVTNGPYDNTHTRAFAPVDGLNDDLDRIRYEIGMLRRGAYTYWNTAFNDPVDAAEATLYKHVVTHQGSGVAATGNPHAMDITDVDDYDVEPAFIRTFAGKSAVGTETPTYSSELVVTTGDNLEVAIGKLDAAYDADHLRTFTGKTGAGAETPTYTSERVVTTADNLEVAIGKLDAAAGIRLTETFTGHVTQADPIIWVHNQGVAYPLVQIVDTSAGDYTGVIVDENYAYEQEHGINTSESFLSIEYVDVNTLHVYTNISDGVIIAVF